MKHATAPDVDRCRATIYDEYAPVERRCSRQAKRDGYCGMHHPDGAAQRSDARLAVHQKYKAA